MFLESKVIEIYCMADDFCKVFSSVSYTHLTLPTT